MIQDDRGDPIPGIVGRVGGFAGAVSVDSVPYPEQGRGL